MKNKEKNLIIILGVLCITLVIIAVVIVAKVYQNKIESNKQAESIKEQVSAITTDNEKNTTRPINTNTTTTNTNTTNSNTTSTNTNTTFQNTTKENTTTSSDTTSSSSNAITSSETEDSEIIGKWNTQKVSDLKANETYDNLKDLYGSSYCFINDSMSTPASFTPPNTSIIFPSAFFSFLGYCVIFTITL